MDAHGAWKDFLTDRENLNRETLTSWLLTVGCPGEELRPTGLGDNMWLKKWFFLVLQRDYSKSLLRFPMTSKGIGGGF